MTRILTEIVDQALESQNGYRNGDRVIVLLRGDVEEISKKLQRLDKLEEKLRERETLQRSIDALLEE